MPFTVLRSIGFTEAEMRVYEALIKKGELKKGTLSKEVALGEKELNALITRLIDFGAIDKNGDRLSPVPPKAFLQKYLKKVEIEKELQMAEMKRKVDEMISILEPIYAEKRLGMKVEELIQPIDALTSMELETVKIISRAKSEVCIFAEQFSWFPKVREELISALDRKVRVKVLLLLSDGSVKERIDEMKRYGIEVRLATCDWRSARYTIADANDLVFLIWARKSGNSKIYYKPAYSRNHGLISVFRDSFEQLWEKAKAL